MAVLYLWMLLKLELKREVACITQILLENVSLASSFVVTLPLPLYVKLLFYFVNKVENGETFSSSFKTNIFHTLINSFMFYATGSLELQ